MADENSSQHKLWTDPRCTLLPLTRRGPFIELSDGSLMTIGEGGMCVSVDEGRTWSEPRPMGEHVNTWESAAGLKYFKTRSGAIVAVYMDMATYVWDWDEENGVATDKTRLDVWAIRSLDEGKTWIDHQKILDGYCGALIDIIQASSGEIVVPVQGLSPDRTRHVQYTYLSADDGETWTRSNMIDLGGRGHHDGAFEATLDELSDGRLLMLIRTSLDQFWRAFSSDKGRTWRVLEPSGIDASNSPGHMVRLASGRLALVWNRLYRKGENSIRRTDDWVWLCERPCSLMREELAVAMRRTQAGRADACPAR